MNNAIIEVLQDMGFKKITEYIWKRKEDNTFVSYDPLFKVWEYDNDLRIGTYTTLEQLIIDNTCYMHLSDLPEGAIFAEAGTDGPVFQYVKYDSDSGLYRCVNIDTHEEVGMKVCVVVYL